MSYRSGRNPAVSPLAVGGDDRTAWVLDEQGVLRVPLEER
jgi:hypothetical protein